MRTRPIRLSCWRAVLAAMALAAVAAPAAPARADIHYVYDVLGRLAGVVDHSGEAAVYRYDPAGNLLAIERLPAGVPAIIAFTPAEGPAGTLVGVDGVAFGPTPAANRVTVNGVAARITAASPTRLEIEVPEGATTGAIAVTAPAGAAASAAPFVVTGPRGPRIAGFAPAAGAAGAPVAIAGERFDPAGATWVTFNGRYAAVRAVTPTAIETAVPAGAGSGRLAVGTPWGQATSAQDFVVLPPPLAAGDVERTVRVANPGAATVAITAPGKVAVALFDAGLGERLAVKLEAVTIAQSAVTVYGPDGTALASAGAVGPEGAALRVAVPATGTCAVVIDPAGAATGAMTLRLGAADLHVAGLDAPAAAATQQRITASWTVRNDGTLDIQGGGWFDLVYLTAPGACCAGATPLASELRHTAPLPPGASYQLTAAFAVPPMPAGAYELTVVTDADNRAWDRDLENNRRAVPLAVTTPDLAATALSAPAAAATQQAIAVSWTVRNRGSGPAPASGWTDAVYLAPTAACCAGATRVAAVRRTAAVNPSTGYSASASVTVPAGPAGPRYLVLVTDADAEVYEAREGNNDRAVPIAIAVPDLAPAELKAPSTVWARASAWVSWTVRNAGTGAAVAAWTDRLYLSPQPTCCAGATALLTVSPPAGLLPGRTYTQLKKVAVPDLPAGTYYVHVRTDDQDRVWETDELNNQMGAAVMLRRLAP